MITIQAYQQYFEQFLGMELANSIYNIDLLDLDNARADISKLTEPVLVVEDFSVMTQGKDADHLVDRYVGAIVLMKKASTRGSSKDDRMIILQEMFENARQIKQQMLRDFAGANNPVMQHLKPASFQLEKLGPVLDSRYGYRLQFEIHERLTY